MPDDKAKDASSTARQRTATRPTQEAAREMTVAIVIMAVLFAVQLLLEHTAFVEATKTQAFSYFQRQLPNTTEERLPIVVLDIGDIAITNKVTDRSQLREVVDALHRAGAAAVGVDIDMSPNEAGFIDRDDDPDLFEHWKALSGEMPVIVGVYRTRNLTPERWLGAEDFASLGAFLGTAKTPDGDRVTQMQSRYRAPESKGEGLPTLGFALAEAYLRRQGVVAPNVGAIMSHLIESVDDEEENRLVNFSKVRQFQRERTLNVAPEAIAGADARNYRNKIVLLGDIELQDLRADSFFAPGLNRLPGVLYHASAIWTFAFEPVYEFNWWTRTVLDLSLGSLFLVAVWARARFERDGKGKKQTVARFFEQYALVVAFVLLLLIAFVAMRLFHIMWLDAIVVALGLLVHYLLPQQVKELFPSILGGGESDERNAGGAAD